MAWVTQQLERSANIAVVGLSPKVHRDSYRVAEYLQKVGYRIIPVTPKNVIILEEQSFPDLRSVPVPIDIVDIFLRAELIPPVIDEAIEVGVSCIWMQDGVIHLGAAANARDAGIQVVMDNCIMREHRLRFRS